MTGILKNFYLADRNGFQSKVPSSAAICSAQDRSGQENLFEFCNSMQQKQALLVHLL